jgi:hypothetical protein
MVEFWTFWLAMLDVAIPFSGIYILSAMVDPHLFPSNSESQERVTLSITWEVQQALTV